MFYSSDFEDHGYSTCTVQCQVRRDSNDCSSENHRFSVRRFSPEESQRLLEMLLIPTMDVTLVLCFLFMIPSLVERNEQIIIDWLMPTMSLLETDDKFFMIGLFCMTNYNEVRPNKRMIDAERFTLF